MNNNSINYKVYRTKEGTILEILCAVLILFSIVLSIANRDKIGDSATGLLVMSLIFGATVALCLVLAYFPRTFNIPDDSPAFLYAATVRFIRLASVLAALMALGLTVCALFAVSPAPMLIGLGVVFACLMAWHLSVTFKAQKNKG